MSRSPRGTAYTGRPLVLSAGRLSALVEDGLVREIIWGKEEAVARIYVGVRAEEWETVPSVVEGLAVERSDGERFRVRLRCRHVGRGIDVRWEGLLDGSGEGNLRFSVSAEVLSTASFNRVGLCLLHRSRLLVGGRLTAHSAALTETISVPAEVAPQWAIGSVELGMTEPFRKLVLEMPSGLRVVERYGGSLFEIEDERNFGDGFFKSYAPPLRDGYPFQLSAGTVIKQSVSLEFPTKGPRVRAAATRRGASHSTQMRIGPATGGLMPPVGIDRRALGPGPIRAPEIGLMRAISPGHLRFDIDLDDESWVEVMTKSFRLAARAGLSVECALQVSDVVDDRLGRFAALAAADRGLLARLLLYSNTSATPSLATIELVMRTVGHHVPEIPLSAGSRGDLCELNRDRPRYPPLVGVTIPTNPGVHLSDDEVAFEGLFGQGDGVASMRSLYPGAAVSVSPVTIAPHTPTQADVTGAVPQFDDARLEAALGASWTAGSVASLASAGAASVTYADFLGAGATRPFVHVLAAAANMGGHPLVSCEVERTDVARAIGVERRSRYDVMVANLRPARLALGLELPPDAARAEVYKLEEWTARPARAPAFWRGAGEELAVRDGRASDGLSPYSVGFYAVHRHPAARGPAQG